jgi:death-on-curing protein
VSEPRWVGKPALLVLHDRTLALHGGASGLRDEGLLDSALARPANRFQYDGQDDLCALAAVYLVGLVANHPFVDDNKRIAFLAAGLFLRLNGLKLRVDQAEAARTVLRVAGGARDEAALAERLRGWAAKA